MFTALDKATGRTRKISLKNVLISPKFPFHIMSEFVPFEQKCTASPLHTRLTPD